LTQPNSSGNQLFREFLEYLIKSESGMSYTSTIEEVNSTRRKFKINVDKSLVTESIGRAATELQKTAQVKGFRKGKVPLSLVKKFYISDVRKKALETIVDETYRKVAEESKLQIVSYPNIEPVGTFDDERDFEFEATVDVNPEVEITGYKNLKLKLDKSKLPEVEKQIETTRKNFLRNAATLEEVTARNVVQAEDYLTLDYKLLENGVLLSKQERKGAKLALDGSNLPEVEKGLLGAEKGKTKSFTVSFPETHNDAALKGKTVSFEATVTKIESLKLPELNEDFVKKFGFKAVEDFEKSLKETVSGSIKKQRLALLKEEMIKKILETNPFEVPESLVDSTIDRAIMEMNSRRPKDKQLKSDDQALRDQHKEWALNEVRGVLALGHIARAEQLKLDDAAVAGEISAFAAQNGMAPQEVIKRYGSQVIEEFRGKVLIDKVVEHIADMAEVEEVAG
jgi:trigger factor